MEKIVDTQTHIFNDNKLNKKTAKITFMLCSLLCFMNIQSSIAQNSNKLVVPVKCANSSNKTYEECIKPCNNVMGEQLTKQSCNTSCSGGGNHSGSGSCNTTCSGSDSYKYTSVNGMGGYFYQNCTGVGRCNRNDTEVRNSVMNQCKASCEIYKNQCSSYEVEIDTVKFLEAMPEIGISRVDPNFIEYE